MDRSAAKIHLQLLLTKLKERGSPLQDVQAVEFFLREPDIPEQTLLEAMAVAVLKGDQGAAVAIRDAIDDRVDRPAQNQQLEEWRETVVTTPSGGRVYLWPEFQALARRLGILYDALTMDMIIEIYYRGPVRVVQRYNAVDTQTPIQHT